MKLYATVASERASKGQGGNDFVRVELQRERGKLSHVLEYTTAGLRLSQVTDDGGVILFEQREETEKGEKQKGEQVREWLKNGEHDKLKEEDYLPQ